MNPPPRQPATLEQALEELRQSRQQLEHLRAKLRLYGDGTAGSFSRSLMRIPRTVVDGLEPLLLVDLEARVIDINQKMCSILFQDTSSAPDPADVKGKRLAEIDRISWAPGLLATLLEDAREQRLPVEFAARHADPSGRTQHYIFHAEVSSRGGHFRVEDISARTRIEEYFSRYVGAEVLELLKEQKEQDFFRTTRRHMSVLFADLRGFTRASSTLSPEQVRDFINEFLEAMIDVVDRNKATVDKIVGDEVMVLCGAPFAEPDHAAQALKVAIGMVEAQERLLERWRQRSLSELHDLRVGIGIHTGEMIVGNIGSRLRTQYTVLGAAVNLAARLCSRALGGQILMSRETFDAVRAVIKSKPDYFSPRLEGFREHAPVEVKGYAEPIPVVLFAR